MRPRIPILAAALVLTAVAANATLTEAIPFDKKVETAATIVLGKVVRTESRWDDSHSRILTYTTIRVEKAFKGRADGDITVVTPGGQVGDVHQVTIGVPTFREGDENVLFVRNTSAGPTVAYFDQGAYAVYQENNEAYVQPVESDAVRIDTQRGVAVESEAARPLRQFESDVREAVGRITAQRMELIERQRRARNQASIWSILERNAGLVLLALVGAMLATWQLTRR